MTRSAAWRVAAGAICISFAPVFVKLAYDAGMGASAIGFWRLALAGILCLALSWRRGRPPYERLRGAEGRILVVAGCLFALDLYVWHRSIVWIGAGIATILGNTQVFWAAGIGHLLFGEKSGRRLWGAILVAFVGVVLLAGAGSEIPLGATERAGLALGLATGLVYAAYLATLKVISRRARSGSGNWQDALAGLAWICLIGAALLATTAGGAPLAPQSASGWVYVALLAVIAQVLGWVLIYQGIAQLATAHAALLLLLQPTLATLWGVLFFAEVLMPLQIAGAALTLAAIYAAQA